MPGLVAGVDSSTQATKVLVVDAGTGAVVATGRAPHPVDGEGGARETHPDAWWEALARRAARDRPRRRRRRDRGRGPAARARRPRRRAAASLRPAMLWNDTRSAEDAAALVAELGAERWAEAIGVVPVASFTVSKWAWLRREEPAAAAAARGASTCRTTTSPGGSRARPPPIAATRPGRAGGRARREGYSDEVLGLPAVDLDPRCCRP